MPQNETVLVYDGDCPFCARYVSLVRLREAVGPVKLLDVRDGGPVVERLQNMGYDFDEGMVLEMDGQVYYGADCIHRLSLLSTDSTLFNKLNAAIFRSRTASRLLYPMLRAGRNLSLALMGRTKLNQHPSAS